MSGQSAVMRTMISAPVCPALEKNWREASHPAEREHVTPYIYRHPESFRLVSFTDPQDLSHHRWTLDTPEDFRLLSAIYEALARPGRIFTTPEILDFLKRHPELAAVNRAVEQKETGL